MRAFQVHRQARQVGQRQQVKSAGYVLRKKQLKTTRIKQDWKHLATKQGPVWSSASSNFLSRSEHKTQSWRFQFTGGETSNPRFMAQAPGQKGLCCSCKASMRTLLTIPRKKVLLTPECDQWSTRNPYGGGAAAMLFWMGQRQPERFCLPVLEENLIALLMLDHILSHCMSV